MKFGLIVLFLTIGQVFSLAWAEPSRSRALPADLCQACYPMESSLSLDPSSLWGRTTLHYPTLDYSRLLPDKVYSGQNPREVINQVADKGLKYWWEMSRVRESSLGRGFSTIENRARQEFILPSSNKGEQKINMWFDLFQTRAKVKYEGFATAEMFYQAKDASVGFLLINKLGKNTYLVLNETMHANAHTASNIFFELAW